MKIVFMGTSLESVSVLSELIKLDIEISAVFTRPAKPFGRGRGLCNPPIKEYADKNKIPLYQYDSFINHQIAYKRLKDISPDLIIVADFGLIIPSEILKLPLLGCLNIHPSLLPKYRGPSPVSSALLNEKKFTGVTIMVMDEGVDTGPIIIQKKIEFLPQENAKNLTERLFRIGAYLLGDIILLWKTGKIKAIPQDESNATYSKKLSRGDGEINWTNSAIDINKKILAYSPWPGAFTYWKGNRMKIIDASLGTTESNKYNHGTTFELDEAIHIATAKGTLILNEIQLEGKKIVAVKKFILGHRDFIKAELG